MPKPLRTALLLAVLIIAYVLVFPKPTGTEPLLERRWALSLDGTGGAPAAAENADAEGSPAAPRVMPFRLGERFGYFRTDGRLLHTEVVRYGLAQSRELYSNYSVISETIVLQNVRGGLVRSIAASGYPLLDHGRLYVFGPNGSTVSEWSTAGEQLWAHDFVSVLTDLDAGDTHTVVGLLDGEVHVLDNGGAEVFSYRTEGSRLRVALAVALGRDEDVFAAVAGVDPQKLILFERHTEGFFPVFQLELDSDYRRPVLLEFLPDGNTLAVEQPAGVLVYHRATEVFNLIELGGKVEAVASLSDFDVLLTASQEIMPGRFTQTGAGVRRVQATVRPDMPLFTQRAGAEDVFLHGDGSRIYFGLNGRLACVELVRG